MARQAHMLLKARVDEPGGEQSELGCVGHNVVGGILSERLRFEVRVVCLEVLPPRGA